MRDQSATNARRSPRVVVVGAGICGVTVAHHLVERGVEDVTVLDGGAPASGTTSAGAGFVGLWSAGFSRFWGAPGLALQRHGLAYYKRLAADGRDLRLHENGNLFLSLSEESWDEFASRTLTHPDAPAGTRRLGPDEVAAVTGVVDASTVHAGVLQPGGIYLETGPTANAIAALLTDAGATVRAGARVTGLAVAGGRVEGVATSDGDVAADVVVSAAGAWTNELLAHVGVELPYLPVVASRVRTRDLGVPATMPTVQCADLQLWLRGSDGGYTYGNAWGYRPLHHLTDEPVEPGKPAFPALIDEMLERLDPLLRPVFPNQTADDVVERTQGIPCYTPDRQFFAGPVPGVEGLYAIAGDNEAGVSHGPGLARIVADLVAHGASELDAEPYRLDRFDPDRYAGVEEIEAAIAGPWQRTS